MRRIQGVVTFLSVQGNNFYTARDAPAYLLPSCKKYHLKLTFLYSLETFYTFPTLHVNNKSARLGNVRPSHFLGPGGWHVGPRLRVFIKEDYLHYNLFYELLQ